jgi:creatinine amidohydrolase
MQTPAQLNVLSELTWIEADAALRLRPIGILPIGATEAHGPHLPIDTDTIIAEATARRAGEWIVEAGMPAIVLPAILYTVTFAGMSFAGTSPVDAEPFERYLASVLTHLCRSGLRGIVVCNAHLEPAHVDRVQAAARAATTATGVPVAAPDQRSKRFAELLSEEFRAGSRHAGAYEASIVLAARPECVRIDAMRQLAPVWIDLPARLRAGARTFAEAGAKLGYFGDPATATAEEGERLLDALAEMVLISCREYQMLNESEAPASS